MFKYRSYFGFSDLNCIWKLLPDKNCCDTLCKKKKCLPERVWVYRGRSITYRDCGSQHHSIAAHFSRDLTTVCRIWNRLVQDGHTECHAGSQRPAISNNWEDKHLTCITLMVFTARQETSVKKWSRFQDNK